MGTILNGYFEVENRPCGRQDSNLLTYGALAVAPPMALGHLYLSPGP